jgi:hypothetical protein
MKAQDAIDEEKVTLKLRVEMLLSENARIKDAHDKEKVIILR